MRSFKQVTCDILHRFDNLLWDISLNRETTASRTVRWVHSEISDGKLEEKDVREKYEKSKWKLGENYEKSMRKVEKVGEKEL